MEEDLRTRGLTDADADRVAEAFQVLGPTLQRWPTTPMVLGALPKRSQRLQIERKKTADEWKQCQKRSAELAQYARQLAASKGAKR